MEADIHVSVMAAMLTLLARRTPFSSSALIVSALVLDRSTVGRSYSGLARRTCFLVRGSPLLLLEVSVCGKDGCD